MHEPLDYERRSTKRMEREWWKYVSGGMCIMGAGLVAIAGALLVGLGSLAANAGNDARQFGMAALLAAMLMLIIGFARWL
jgi:hypothetical protein